MLLFNLLRLKNIEIILASFNFTRELGDLFIRRLLGVFIYKKREMRKYSNNQINFEIFIASIILVYFKI